ncbi:MAG: PH domain-containing protein [Ignavibacteriaceae bacterium]|nr:PH domain-containing protein [Ignavibacteriaceae bacterium]
MEIRPDKKLFTKQLYVLLTISFLVLIVATILQVTIPLDPKITASGVAPILWTIVFGVIFLLWLIAVPTIKLWIRNLSYYIDEDRVTIHKGILSKIKQNVPYRAITDFQLHRSLYDRFLGIASIKLQTAGQSPTATGFEAKLSGLIDWDNLLEQLRAKVKMLYPQTKTAAADSTALTDKDLLQNILNELKEIKITLSKD